MNEFYEPWYDDGGQVYGSPIPEGRYHGPLMFDYQTGNEDGAGESPLITRAIACVNACNGINPEAVPDLLAACQLWDQGFVDGEEFTADQFLAWVTVNRRAARAAIAKATGGQKSTGV